MEHEAVAEAAVVGRPHPVKGESLYCFVTLTEGLTYNRTLEAELKRQGADSLETEAESFCSRFYIRQSLKVSDWIYSEGNSFHVCVMIRSCMKS